MYFHSKVADKTNKNNKDKKSRVVCAQTSPDNITSILLALYEQGNLNEMELSKHASRIGEKHISKYIVNNTLPVTNDMELTFKINKRFKKDIPEGIYLTSSGRELAGAIKEENQQKIKEVAFNAIKKSVVLKKAYDILNENKNISYDELGEIIKNEFNRKWSHPHTKKHVARTCVHILQAFYIVGDLRRRIIRKGKKYGYKKEEGVQFTASANQIFGYTKKLNIENETEVTTPFQLERRNDKILSELTTLLDLGLVEEHNKKFKLTSLGNELKNALETSKEAEIFRKILLRHEPSRKFIHQLASENEPFKIMCIGRKLEEYNQTEWSEDTARSHGSKFLNCMKKAAIAVENGKRGNYRINKSVLEELPPEGKLKEESIPSTKSQQIPIEISLSKPIQDITDNFKELLYEVFIDDDWQSNVPLKEKIENKLVSMENEQSTPSQKIIIQNIIDWIKVAYKYSDVIYMQKAGNYYKKLKNLD